MKQQQRLKTPDTYFTAAWHRELSILPAVQQHGTDDDSPEPARRPLPAEALLVHGTLGGFLLLLVPERTPFHLAVRFPPFSWPRFVENELIGGGVQ